LALRKVVFDKIKNDHLLKKFFGEIKNLTDKITKINEKLTENNQDNILYNLNSKLNQISDDIELSKLSHINELFKIEKMQQIILYLHQHINIDEVSNQLIY
jgi:glycosylphosphatidylinositol transamidase (GPIT) subunit GPI8